MIADVASLLAVTARLVAGLWLYGWLVGFVWTPFLLAERLWRLFDALPPGEWWANYAVWIPAPAVLWGVLFGIGLSLSSTVRRPGRASALYVAGVDGIALATLVSLLLWPTLVLYVLPARGFDWDPADYGPTTVGLVVGGVAWYLLCLAGPAYALSVFAGFGDAMSGP